MDVCALWPSRLLRGFRVGIAERLVIVAIKVLSYLILSFSSQRYSQIRSRDDASPTSPLHPSPRTMSVATRAPIAPGGIKSYYQAKIEAAELTINQKTQNLRRLEAQRNALNARGGVRSCSWSLRD